MFINTNEEAYFQHENILVEQEPLFKYVEIESLIKTPPNGKSGGIDGVSNEDLKDSCDEYCHVLVNIMNVMLINHRLSCRWKEAVIQRNLKRNFNIEDHVRYLYFPFVTKYYRKPFSIELFQQFRTRSIFGKEFI